MAFVPIPLVAADFVPAPSAAICTFFAEVFFGSTGAASAGPRASSEAVTLEGAVSWAVAALMILKAAGALLARSRFADRDGRCLLCRNERAGAEAGAHE